MLPSEYTSQASLNDAKALAKNLNCRYDFVPISEERQAIGNTLAPLFDGLDADLTEENIQSRLRGLLLMALSNKFGEMLLTTGNKSEVAVDMPPFTAIWQAAITRSKIFTKPASLTPAAGEMTRTEIG